MVIIFLLNGKLQLVWSQAKFTTTTEGGHAFLFPSLKSKENAASFDLIK